jgi:hypothetical protein
MLPNFVSCYVMLCFVHRCIEELLCENLKRRVRYRAYLLSRGLLCFFLAGVNRVCTFLVSVRSREETLNRAQQNFDVGSSGRHSSGFKLLKIPPFLTQTWLFTTYDMS